MGYWKKWKVALKKAPPTEIEPPTELKALQELKSIEKLEPKVFKKDDAYDIF